MLCELITEKNIENFLDSFDNVLTDCDGVLWHGNNSVPGTVETLNKLRKLGKKVFFVTNNSMKTRDEFAKKCNDLGYVANMDEMYCTGYLAAAYLKKLGFNQKVYVVGSKGITKELDNVGIRHLGEGPDVLQGSMTDWVNGGVDFDPEVGAVIVGFDEHISYPKILKAASYLNNPECIFIGTNTDERLPLDKSIVVPGSGSILAAVKTAAERAPVIIGKPMPYIFECIQAQHKLKASRTIMIGDRLNTDILLGANCGLKTVLVLTGISNLAEVKLHKEKNTSNDNQLVPDFYLNSLGDLGSMMK